MAQTTSALWRELFETPGTTREYGFDISGVWYGTEAEVSNSVSNDLYGEFGFGNAACAKLTLEIYADNIPKGATIKRFIRLANGDLVSEWLPKGIFFTNRRAVDDGFWVVEAFDAMLKGEQTYLPDTIIDDWPKPMTDAVNECAERMGVTIDPRTVINPAYMLEMPVGYTVRQVLAHIAAAHGGNFIITDVGELYLVPLLSAPAESYNLVTERGSAITLGGVRLIV